MGTRHPRRETALSHSRRPRLGPRFRCSAWKGASPLPTFGPTESRGVVALGALSCPGLSAGDAGLDLGGLLVRFARARRKSPRLRGLGRAGKPSGQACDAEGWSVPVQVLGRPGHRDPVPRCQPGGADPGRAERPAPALRFSPFQIGKSAASYGTEGAEGRLTTRSSGNVNPGQLAGQFCRYKLWEAGTKRRALPHSLGMFR